MEGDKKERKMSFYRNQLDLMIGYISAIIKHANDERNSISERNNLNSDQFFDVFIEYIFFFLHLAYRRIYSLTEEKKSEILMNQMADLTIRAAIDFQGFFLDEEIKHELYDKCVQDFMNAMSDYGKLPEYTKEKDGSGQMPLYWHFQKKIATLSGKGSNPAVIIGLGVTLVARVKDLNINFFAKELVSDRWESE
jgi:hypothetical protein